MAKLKEKEYYPAVKQVFTDGNYVFVFTHAKKKGAGHFVDVFDGERQKYLRSVYISLDPREIQSIAGGYIYKFNDWQNSGEFPSIEKYRIDPAVYGK